MMLGNWFSSLERQSLLAAIHFGIFYKQMALWNFKCNPVFELINSSDKLCMCTRRLNLIMLILAKPENYTITLIWKKFIIIVRTGHWSSCDRRKTHILDKSVSVAPLINSIRWTTLDLINLFRAYMLRSKKQKCNCIGPNLFN